MFSGGIDSTAMLYHLLTDKEYMEYDIHAHFIVLINKEGRHNAEISAAKSCVDWFKKNCRPFILTDNVIDFSFFRGDFPWDADVMSFVDAEIIINYGGDYKYVAYGQTKTDLLTREQASENSGTFPDYSKSIMLLDMMLKEYNKEVERIFPLKDMTKKEAWDMMPVDLRKSTWSCRKPQYINNVYVPCGVCRTCVQMKKEKVGYYE